MTTYQPLLDQDYEILAVLISEKLSGTLSSALQAKDMPFPGKPLSK
jgi:fatty acid-binding protein DegV